MQLATTLLDPMFVNVMKVILVMDSTVQVDYHRYDHHILYVLILFLGDGGKRINYIPFFKRFHDLSRNQKCLLINIMSGLKD